MIRRMRGLNVAAGAYFFQRLSFPGRDARLAVLSLSDAERRARARDGLVSRKGSGREYLRGGSRSAFSCLRQLLRARLGGWGEITEQEMDVMDGRHRGGLKLPEGASRR